MARSEPAGSLDRRAWTLAAAATAFGCLYFFVRQYFKDGIWRFDLTLVNKSLGVAALLLLALSMLLTARSYFSRRPGRALPLRKPYGLTGFWLGAVHGAVDHVVLPAIGLHAEPKSVNLYAEAAGWAALALFAVMTLISNERARKRIGDGIWRKVLRYAGYAGLALAAAHAAFLKSASWSKYFRTFDSVLPSLSLFVFALAVAAILLRLAIGFAERRKK
jgi:DMSO/TMAO reductase YedYZ heme-binding membrane subunit